MVYADADPAVSCARYFGTRLARAQTAEIGVTWTGESTFTVTVPQVLTWHVKVAGLMLGVGRVRLRGTVPNGQRFQAAPLGDFWLPQRGMVVEGRSSFEALDTQRHSTATSR